MINNDEDHDDGILILESTKTNQFYHNKIPFFSPFNCFLTRKADCLSLFNCTWNLFKSILKLL